MAYIIKRQKKANIESNDLDTRRKVLTEANALFSQHGFHGTSLRVLSRRAKVNLAAVNYHFRSKENLYFEVVRNNVLEVDQLSKEIFKKSKSTEQFVLSFYDALVGGGDTLLSQYRVFMIDIPLPRDIIEIIQVGRPEVIKIIENDLKKIKQPHSSKKVEWMASVILNYVFHMALVASTHLGSPSYFPPSSKKQVHHDIKKLIKALFNSN